jgi:tetraacyldisaccharide 4'-kinase
MQLDNLAERVEASWWTDDDGLAKLLAPLGWIYGGLWRLLSLAYDRGWLKRRRLPVPVLVIGNLIVGGAGKTPVVIATVRWLRAHGYTPGIVSRGHGRDDGRVVEVKPDSAVEQVGDEPLLLRLRAGAPVVVGRDRVAAATELLRLHPRTDIVVTDDGAQHLALDRDVTVYVFDDRGVGNGRLLPAGPQREPMAKRPPLHSVVLYNATTPSTHWPGGTSRRQLGGLTELGDWWRGAAPSHEPFEILRQQESVVAAAGIARPERFFEMLEAAGLTIDRCPLPDHHDYRSMPWRGSDLHAIVTEKDAVKLRPERVLPTKVWVATLDFEPDGRFADALRRRLPGPRAAAAR